MSGQQEAKPLASGKGKGGGERSFDRSKVQERSLGSR